MRKQLSTASTNDENSAIHNLGLFFGHATEKGWKPWSMKYYNTFHNYSSCIHMDFNVYFLIIDFWIFIYSVSLITRNPSCRKAYRFLWIIGCWRLLEDFLPNIYLEWMIIYMQTPSYLRICSVERGMESSSLTLYPTILSQFF